MTNLSNPVDRAEWFWGRNQTNSNNSDKITDFTLLGYSDAKLPSDGFTIVNPFSNTVPPFEFLADIQGCRFNLKNMPYKEIEIGMKITFEPEADNQQDSDAVIAMINGQKIGYLCRGLNDSF